MLENFFEICIKKKIFLNFYTDCFGNSPLDIALQSNNHIA